MKIGLIAYGTRGDVQPILALAKGLNAARHCARVIAAENFGDWVRSHGLDFAPIRVDIQAMMQSGDGVAWVEAKNVRQEMAQMRRLFDRVGLQSARDALAAAEGLDMLMGGLTSDCFGRSIAEKRGLRYAVALLQPMHPTRLGAATLRPAFARRTNTLNRWMGKIGQRVIYGVFADVTNRFRAELGLQPFTAASYYAGLERVTTLNGYSQHVTPMPDDWPATQHITGYWFLDEDAHWQPPSDLEHFIAAGPAPVYVGFGSATGSDAQRLTRMIVDALKQSGQRGIIAQGWAGLHAEDLPGSIYLLKSAPHGWLFPRMAGVVHHGGAGTTAAGLRSGVPSFLIPHFADQPYWARRVHELGAGPKPVDKAKLTQAALADGIRQLVSDTAMRQRAAELGAAIRAEDGVANAVRVIEAMAG
jgi:UDP:flavonoid glycosyltransferase YjiC (YdhE family)